MEPSVNLETDLTTRLTALLRGLDSRVKTSVVGTVIFGLVAHGYCYANLLLIHDAVRLYNPTPGVDITTGRIADTVVKALRENITMPWLIGLASLLIIGLAVYFLVRIFDMRRPLLIVLLSGLVVTFPTVTCANLYIFCADQIALALFFACLSAYLIDRGKWGLVAAGACLVASLMLYQAYLCVAATVMLCRLIMDVLFGSLNDRQLAVKSLKYLLVLVASTLLYYFLWVKSVEVLGLQVSSYRGMDQAGQINVSLLPELLRDTYRMVWQFLTVPSKSFIPPYTRVTLWLSIVGVAACLTVVIVKNALWRNKPLQLAAALVFALLLPLAINLMTLLDKNTGIYILMQHAFLQPWIAVVVLCDTLSDRLNTTPPRRRLLSGATVCVLLSTVLMLYNCTLGANMSYVKVQASRETTLSYCTRVIDRIESEPGYSRDTEVVLVGVPPLAERRVGFWWCDNIMIASFSSGITYYDVGVSFLRYLDPSLKLAGNDAGYGEIPAVEGLDAFPQEDCTLWVDGVLVIKLAEP